MDPNQTLDYSLEGAKWLGLGIGVGYSTLIFVGPLTSGVLSKKIRSQEELDSIVVEESKRLGLEGIKGFLVENTFIDKAYMSMEGDPVIVMGRLATRDAVKHELYHHKKDHTRRR